MKARACGFHFECISFRFISIALYVPFVVVVVHAVIVVLIVVLVIYVDASTVAGVFSARSAFSVRLFFAFSYAEILVTFGRRIFLTTDRRSGISACGTVGAVVRSFCFLSPAS